MEGVVVADLEGRILYWNPAALEMHGFGGEARRDLGGGPPALLRAVHGRRRRAAPRVAAHRVSFAASSSRTYSFGSGDADESGSGRSATEAAWSAASNGRGLMAVFTLKDVSEREQARRRLASERQRLAVTLRSIGDAVIATDDGGPHHPAERCGGEAHRMEGRRGGRATAGGGLPHRPRTDASSGDEAPFTAPCGRAASSGSPTTPRSLRATGGSAPSPTPAPPYGRRMAGSPAPSWSSATRPRSEGRSWRSARARPATGACSRTSPRR